MASAERRNYAIKRSPSQGTRGACFNHDCPCHQAPDAEKWGEEFDKRFHGDDQIEKFEIKSFIRSLLQAAREEGAQAERKKFEMRAASALFGYADGYREGIRQAREQILAALPEMKELKRQMTIRGIAEPQASYLCDSVLSDIRRIIMNEEQTPNRE
jgi:flagellar biosynthesis/type III secretory pathway protein FliH